ncbi:MAG TPA: DUF3443 domain-containing protein, partial [Mycobacteriales bacterium]|nr:DUF3443 domain-containing protein [Mycobacteriales bacterium]
RASSHAERRSRGRDPVTAIIRPALLAVAFAAAQIAPQCGSSSTTTPSTGTPASTLNMQSVVVNSGPNNDYANGLFTSVTVCVPGTSSCQLISGILVDTGSTGLRVLSSALNNLNLPQQTATSGPVVECAQFQDGFTWGPVQTADVKLAGETASSVPIQVIGSPSFSTIPSGCANSGGTAEDSLGTLSANGILGVGLFREDCGPPCASSGSSNPGFYYSCPSSGCIVIAQPSAKQLQNPVSMFATDNNGVVIQLPSVAPGGAATLTGSMTFGIGTQSDNALGSAKVYTTDGTGSFTTVFNGQSLASSFIDSGSNGFFFVDAASSGLPVCLDTSDFYCPAPRQSFSATTRGANGTTSTVSFSIDNADTLLRARQFSVFGELGGPNAGAFDWGLPFFYGRTVFTAIDGQSTPGGTGPYWAY